MRAITDVADLLTGMCAHALNARHEEDLLGHISRALRLHVGCDAVIVRLLERYVQTRAVSLPEETRVLAVDELRAEWTHEDERRWLGLRDGIFTPDLRAAHHIKPAFREHVLSLGLVCSFMVPIVRDGEIYGQLVFGWRYGRSLSEEERYYLRRVSDYVGLALTAYQVSRRQEIDPLTGVLNRLGLQRRWEVVSRVPTGTLLLADLDQFREAHLVHGRLAGERFLQEVAGLLKREGDSRSQVARYGTDEFVVLVPGYDLDQARALRASLRIQVRQLAKARSLSPVGISVGVAHWPTHGMDLDRLLEAADEDLHLQRARERGAAPGTPADPR